MRKRSAGAPPLTLRTVETNVQPKVVRISDEAYKIISAYRQGNEPIGYALDRLLKEVLK